MFIVYVDESGDTGIKNSPTQYYILSSLVVHESNWLRLLDEIIDLRRELKRAYGLKLREEIHAVRFFSKPGKLARIEKHNRLQICKRIIDFQEKLDYISLVNVVVDKSNKSEDYDVFENAWSRLIQRIHNTIYFNNFPGGFNLNEKAIIIPDKTDDKKLRTLVRKMRRFNYVPYVGGMESRPIEIKTVIEDPYLKDSKHSFFHQLVDVNAYFLYQSLKPNKYIKKKKGHNFFNRFDKALCKHASRTDPKGIVWI